MRKHVILFTTIICSALASASAWADDTYDDCKRAIKNSPNKPHTYCRGYTKGYDDAEGSGTSGSGTGSAQRETVAYRVGAPGASTTTGTTVDDIIAVTLDPGFKDIKKSGRLNWASVSDLKLKQEVKTSTVTQPGLVDSFSLQQSQMSVQEYLNNGGNKKSMKDLEEKIKGLDNNKAYTIYLQRSD